MQPTMQAVAAAPTASFSTGWWQRAVPVACGCAMVGAAGLVARFDPSAKGSRFPACQFHRVTGLWCPGCGLTRGFHQLFNGHLLSAMQFNVFVPLVLVAIAASWWSWLRTSWGRSGLQLPARLMRPLAMGMPVALVAYGVLRNIPVAPFRSLAP